MNNSNLQEVLYNSKSISQALEKYSELLRSTEDITEISHAAKIEEYKDLIADKKFIYRICRNFNGIYTLIDRGFPDVRFSIDGRCKSLISTEKKMRKLISENRSLDLLRDIFAFRILLFGKNTTELIKTCYLIAQKVIEYSLEIGLTLCEADAPRGIDGFDKEKHQNILIPKKSLITKNFQYGVKDYILNPKDNGYQSIHLTFRTKDGICFEVQIRTFDMHLHAESGEANHSGYKKRKYSNFDSIILDREKIQIPGYGISSSGELFDFIGLEKGLEVLKRQKTY